MVVDGVLVEAIVRLERCRGSRVEMICARQSPNDVVGCGGQAGGKRPVVVLGCASDGGASPVNARQQVFRCA